MTCENCHIPGHTKDQCFRIVGYPPGHKLYKNFPQTKNSRFNSRSPKFSAHNSFNTAFDLSPTDNESKAASPMVHTFTDAQYQQLLRLLDHSSHSTDATANLAGTATSLMTFSKETDWILDTGANAHITGTSSCLQTPQPCTSTTGSISLPNGTSTPIISHGSVHLSPSVLPIISPKFFSFLILALTFYQSLNSPRITIALLFFIHIFTCFRTS